VAVVFAGFCASGVTPARADLIQSQVQTHLTILATFDSTITSDPNAAQIESAINSAISAYQSNFSDPITVNITFQEGRGLGSSTFGVYTFSYYSFYNALLADATTADDTAALARLAQDPAPTGITSVNPVTGTTFVHLKAANARAIGLNCGCGNEGGTITLNTNVLAPGSLGSSGAYNLVPVVEHEIDEILGLGSTLGLGLTGASGTYPYAEDFFRFASAGTRSFSESSSITSYFSIDGATDLAQFNQNLGGDYGDWASNPLPPGVAAQVQDAFATPGALPSLGVELRALDVIGYNRVVTPEPGTMFLMGGGLLLAAFARRRRNG